MKDAVSAWTGADENYAITTAMEGSGTFAFPGDEGSRRVSFYVGTGFDEYEFQLQRYDVYRPRQGTTGSLTEHRQTDTVTVNAHIPKQVVYSVAGGTMERI